MSDNSNNPGRPPGSVTIPKFGAPVNKPGPKPQALVQAGLRRVGRPPGFESKLKELREKLIMSKGDAVLDKIIQIALDDNHKDQAAMLKLLGDRVINIGAFQGAADKGNKGLHIKVTGVDGSVVEVQSGNQDPDDQEPDYIDMETSPQEPEGGDGI